MKIWHGILLIMLVLTLPLTGCGKSSEAASVGTYLGESTSIIDEATETAREEYQSFMKPQTFMISLKSSQSVLVMGRNMTIYYSALRLSGALRNASRIGNT